MVCLYLLNSMSPVYFADERSISMFRLLLRFPSLLFYLNNVIVYLTRYIYIVGETYDVVGYKIIEKKKSAWPVSKRLLTKKRCYTFRSSEKVKITYSMLLLWIYSCTFLNEKTHNTSPFHVYKAIKQRFHRSCSFNKRLSAGS